MLRKAMDVLLDAGDIHLGMGPRGFKKSDQRPCLFDGPKPKEPEEIL